MSTFALAPLSSRVDPVLRAGVLAELDAALAGLDDAASVLAAVREQSGWQSEGADALRLALRRLEDDTTLARAMLQECREDAEDA